MEREDLYSDRVQMRHRRKTLKLTLIVCASLACSAGAELPTVVPIAPEPVGSGARALGQSAFIAVADDATAASWNPAGLLNLEKPEASFVGLWKTVTNDPSLSDSSVSLDGGNWDDWEINFMSYAQPISVGNRDAVLSVNYHQVYDFGLESGTTVPDILKARAVSKGAIAAYSLAGGLSLSSSPSVTLGASFNWHTHSLHHHYVRRVEQTLQDLEFDVTSRTTETLDDFRGYNFTFGFLWDMYEKDERLLTLGLVCHTPYTAKVYQEVVDIPEIGDPVPFGPYRLDVDFPLSLGAGVNYRFSDEFSTAFDAQWTEWSQYGTSATPSLDDDAVALRLGFERLWFPKGTRESVFAWRGGVFYEPRPAWSDILPVYGFSQGLGWTLKERFSLDFAYQFRWGEDEDFTLDATEFDYRVEEHLLIGSVIVYFR